MSENAKSDPPADASDAPSAPAKPTTPFFLEHGGEIRRGTELGRVTAVRGNGDVPYEVRIRWKSARHPEWQLYRTLARQYEEGQLEVLKPGRQPLLRRLCPFL